MFIIICLAVLNGLIGGNLYMFSSHHHKPAKAASVSAHASTVVVPPPAKVLYRQVRVVNLSGGDIRLFETSNERADGRETKIFTENMKPGEWIDLITKPLAEGEVGNRYTIFAQGYGFCGFRLDAKMHQFDLARPQKEQVWEITK